MRKVEQIGSLRFATLRPRDYVRGPRVPTEDLATAQYWADWVRAVYGRGDEPTPDPVLVCERAGIRVVTLLRAELPENANLWRGTQEGPISKVVLGRENTATARGFHYELAQKLAEIVAQRHRVRRVNRKQWNRACARALLVPPDHLRLAWEVTGRSFEQVCDLWNNVPPTVLAKRVAECWITDVWIYHRSLLRYAHVRPRSARPPRATGGADLLVSRLSDGPDRVVVLAAA